MSVNEVITVAALAAVMLLLVTIWALDRRRSRRGGGRTALSGALGTIDEVFHPEAARAAEIRELQDELQDELPVDAPSPGDPYRLDLSGDVSPVDSSSPSLGRSAK